MAEKPNTVKIELTYENLEVLEEAITRLNESYTASEWDSLEELSLQVGRVEIKLKGARRELNELFVAQTLGRKS